METVNIKINNLDVKKYDQAQTAVEAVKQFEADYPDRSGKGEGVVYTRDNVAYHVYRGKTMTVVSIKNHDDTF